MIRISQIKLRPGHTGEELLGKAAGLLKIAPQEIKRLEILRQSIDARKKPDIFYIYTVDVEIAREEKLQWALFKKDSGIQRVRPLQYQFPGCGSARQKHPTVIVGTGPAGLFCGYFLALHGYRPVLLERGRRVEERQQDVEAFWREGRLDPASNVQFGEGGAGTFSDGKLNTLVKDKSGRNRAVLQTFVRFGAGESILYEAKPHLGTDVLGGVVQNMRQEILRLGGEVRFESQVTELLVAEGRVQGVVVNGRETIACEQVVLACGHSARDTFSMLYDRKIPMEAKAFAVGFRVEHPQERINLDRYGVKDPGVLGAAPYKVAAKTSLGRGVYSFCMCPGGYVVNASSEEGRLAVNGMSYSGRDGRNANSAIIVAVTPKDFDSGWPEGGIHPGHPLSGVEFQRRLEEKAYRLARGKIPVQRYGDFRLRVTQGKAGEDALRGLGRREALQQGPGKGEGDAFLPACKGEWAWADLSGLLPGECNQAFVEGMGVFGRQIPGFDGEDVLLSGVESRTSSPVRILRDESLQSLVRGLYPCGEGAGYAGGITSAAMDGLHVAEKIAEQFAPYDR